MPAGNGIIGALLVSLGIDTAAFDTGLKETEGKVGKFGAAMSSLGGAAMAGLVAGVAVAGAAFIKFGLDSLSAADDIGDAAARIGITAEAYQKLGIAATAAGGTPELMTEAMDKLNENMGAFVQTGGGKAADAFKTLGLASQITSGQIGTADQAFYAIAKAMESIEDPALKARISTQLFGKSAGVDMLEVLGPGADALKAYGQEAQNTGRIMSDEMVQKLSDAKLALDNTKTAAGQMATVLAGEAVVAIVDMAKELSPLWEQAKALWSQVSAYLMPSIRDLGKAMVNFAQGPAGQFMLAVLGQLGKLMGVVLVTAANLTIKAFTAVFNVLDGVAKFIAPVVEKLGKAFGWLKGILSPLIKLIPGMGGAFDALNTKVGTTVPPMIDTVETNFARLPQVMTNVVTRETGKVKKAFEELRKSYVDWSEGNNGKIKPFELGKISDRDINTNDPKILANDYTKAMKDAADAAREHNREVFSETFSDGIMAALNGDLGSFFTRWWQQSLTKDLDALGAKLFDILGSFSGSQTGISGSGLFSGIGNALSSLFGSSPHNANGGTYALKGGGPVDSKLFSSWVSPDEIIKIGQAEDFSGGAMALTIEPSPWFDVRAKEASRPMAADYATQAATTGVRGGAALAETQMARKQRSWMP